VSVVPLNLDNVEKTVTYTTAVKNTSDDSFKIEIPILPSNALVQSLRSNPGCTSVSVNWASPSVPLKGTVKAYDGSTLVATVIESTFKTAHNVIVPNLQKGKTCRFTVECLNQGGQTVPGGEVSATTAPTCPERVESATCNTLTLSNPSATAGPDYIDFSWTTNQLASTEVMFSPSPDLLLNYVMAVKKVGDVVTQGWVTREGPRQFETNHGIRLAELEPNTKYYYNLRSWTFINNDETNNPQDKVGCVGNITTLPGSPPPTVKIRVRSPSEGNISIPDMPVILTKSTDLDFRLSVSTGQSGVSNDVILDKGTTYTFEAQGNACYEYASTQVEVAGTAQGALPEVVINVNKIAPRRGTVFNSQNQPIAGATVSGKNSQGAPVSVQTTTNGSWVIDSGLNPGSYTFTVSKDGYRTTTANITVNSCGRFIGLPVTMVPRDYTLNVVVKNQANKPVKNATVLVKEGDATIATLTTDTQGKATKAGTFNDDNEHIFTIAVTPPEATKENILPTQDFASITSASTRNVTITCPADKKAPVPSQISITQVGKNALQVSFKLDDENGNSSVEYQSPQGLIKNTPWKTGMSSPGSGMSDHTVLVQGSAMKPGTYKIKVKSKDKWNNMGESEVREFLLFGESLWDFKIASQAASDITFTWKKYPHSEKFGKYTITVGTQAPIEIADINTTTYTLTNYASTAVRQVKLTARASDNTGDLALPATVSLQAVAAATTTTTAAATTTSATTTSATTTAATTTAATTTSATTTTAQQAQQGGQTTGGETQTQQTQQTGQGTQIDVNQAGGTTQTNQAGAGSSSQTGQAQQEQGQLVQEKTLLKFIDKPMKAYANREVSFEMVVQTQKSKKVAATCSLDWGDGKRDEADTVVPFKHIYQKAGKYKISATASLKESGAFSLPQPISADITVSVMPPKVALTKSTPKGGVPGYDFMIKAEEGSYPIVKWTLSFGDGSNDSGEGKVSKSINHVYSAAGSYNVEFSIEDSTGAITKKSLNLKIVPKKQSP
jgi:hypothetical protein